MLYAQVWKTGATGGGLSANSYYVDGYSNVPNDADYYCFQVSQFDAYFSPSSSMQMCVTLHAVGGDSSFPDGSCYVWVDKDHTYNGSIGVGTPLSSRWALDMGFYPLQGRPSHRNYHGSVGEENLAYNHRGYPMLKGWTDWEKPFNTYCDFRRCYWRQWLNMGEGNAVPGNAFSFEPIKTIAPVGITVTNKSKRYRSLMFQSARSCKAQIIGAAAACATQFQQMQYWKNLAPKDFYPADWKAIVSRLQSAVLVQLNAMVEMQRGGDDKDGNKHEVCNDENGWNSRFGVGAAQAKDLLKKYEQQQKQEQKRLQQISNFTDAGGDEYFHRKEAMELYDMAEPWLRRSAAYCLFDWGNPDQKQLKDMTRLDDYSPHWPDLDYKSEFLPLPRQSPKRRVETYQSALTHLDINVKGTLEKGLGDYLTGLF